MAMSGDATEAYAFLLQAINTTNLLDGHLSGRTDIGSLAKQLRKVYADSRKHVSGLPVGVKTADVPNLQVMLVGWCWRKLRFEGYAYFYDSLGKLVMQRVTNFEKSGPGGVYFFGDAAQAANKQLRSEMKLVNLRKRRPGGTGKTMYSELDWQPLKVLCDVIEDPAVRTVGGVPQVLKIYQYGSTESFVWRDEQDRDSFGGRRVLAKERSDRRFIKMISGLPTLFYSDSAMH